MKQLYMIGGTMGVGKTTVAKSMNQRMNKSVLLDGDWCWYMNPFIVNMETKTMVEDNICHVLNNYLKCSEYENIIFCWVMDLQSTINRLLDKLNLENCEVHLISLVCDEESLTKRLSNDINLGLRKQDVINRSLSRIKRYSILNTIKIDTSNLTTNEIVDKIINYNK